MRESVIVSAVRTPTGKFLGGLKDFPATDLGALVVRETVRRAGVDPAAVDECIMGNVVSAGLGQAPARQAALKGGLHNGVGALTINKVCGSGLKAVMLAAQGIATGDIDIAVAGGMESMSNCPYLLKGVREGLRMGDGKAIDSMILDGLWDSFTTSTWVSPARHVSETYRSRAKNRTPMRSRAIGAPRTPRGKAGSGTRFSRSSIPQRKGDPVRCRQGRVDPRGYHRRVARTSQAGVQEGRHRHGGQRARRQRRRGRPGGDGGRGGRQARISSRSRGWSARPRQASSRNS